MAPQEPSMKLSEIAENLGCRLEGDPNIEIHGVGGN